MKDESHEITLNEASTVKDFLRCIQILEKLSIAEIDYQLRTFLLNPINKQYILKMMEKIFDSNCQNIGVSE